MEKTNKMEVRRIGLFVLISFVLAYAWTISLIWPRMLGVDLQTLPQEELVVNASLTAVLMFFPALSVVITRLITREGFKNSMLPLNLRGNVRYYLIGWFGPMVLTILGAVLYYAIYPDEFTLTTLETTMASQPIPPAAMVVMLLLSPWLNLIPCLGEEWGWRGYLLPKVAARMGFLPTILLTGLIWGLWHAPMIVVGHNYGMGYAGYPWVGIGAMCLFCIASGTLLSYITLKTRSCWPAVLAHGVINGTAAVGTLFLANPMAYDRFVGPVPTGVIGGFAYLFVAVWLVWRMRRDA